VTGLHRAERPSRWRLLVSAAAALLGGGYAGRHRLADVALVRPLPEPTAVATAAATGAAVPSRAVVPPAGGPAVVPRLTLVPAGSSPFSGRAPHHA
jgi:hypothetical protein